GEITHFPPKTLLTLEVPQGGTFPKECRALLMLAEIDGGGFNDIAEKAFAKLKEETAKAKADMEARGAGVAGLTWAAIWAVVLPIVIGYLKEKLSAGVSDDVFYPRDIAVEIGSEDFRWGDGTKLSPEETVEFRGHDSVYKVTYYWEVRNTESGRTGLPDVGRAAGGGVISNG
ncbi:MAG: hypothetical protein QUS14_03260, partial [Pyrinomonadaceae bacterium]|nr:hypothetical protein [Pyrinomonadaceae bacterium]